MKKRALVSVSDKTNLSEFARELAKVGWELVSTGGTARFLRESGVDVVDVSRVTGFPEILSGRVKTLHPSVHGGILARRDDPGHMEELSSCGINPFDMVVCNLYPFVEAALNPEAGLDEIIEQIDIGGPTLLRAAAKNFAWVVPVSNPRRYPAVIEQLKTTGDVDRVTRRDLAVETFYHTASYDAAIASYLGTSFKGWPLDFPQELTFGYLKVLNLRYGENPHQKAAFYEPVIDRDVTSLRNAQIQGKDLSYNNINDAQGAFKAVWDLPQPACVIVKHAAPCGSALGASAREAFEKAFQGDPVSAFGGVVAFNCPVDRECAVAMKKVFLEVVLAPSYAQEALDVLKAKKDLRVLKVSPCRTREPYTVKPALGGLLVQEEDALLPEQENWQVVSERAPSEQEMEDLKFAMAVCKHVRSNAVVMAKDGATVGIGGGQPNRVDCVRVAAARGKEKTAGSCMASDAFFPFPDAVEEAARAGITAIAHPGGSIRDKESLEAANAHGMAMIITGSRHFLH